MAKKLLEEATVRRFMKIAGIKSLNENFAQELEEEVVEEMYKEEEPGMEADEEMPEAPEAPEAGEEMAPEEGEEEVELEVEGGKDEAVELLAKLADMLGVEVEVEGDEGGEEPEMEEPADEEMPEEPAPEGEEEEVMEEGEHTEEPAKGPAGENMESPPKVDDADPKDPNQDPSIKEQDPMKATGEHMAESREAFKKRLVEQVAKRVAARLKNLK